ncbi:MAG: restriction endonuclease subunit S [Nitrospira sp.]|nr:restriction endonuclease subunit S [Nitrospira sp.]
MKLKRFFEKFDQLADAPSAVTKMRELILQLAASGKLCSQDPSEEPASMLLAKISGANKSRYACGEIRLRLTALIAECAEAIIPEGWSSVSLGEIADVNWGNTSLTKKSYTEAGFTAYSATGPDGWIDHAEFSGPGIVLSAIGARSGKCFLADGKWTAIKNTITIIPFDPISNDWLFRVINRESAWKKRGGAQPFIALKDAISLPILLPPLAEQKRIVAKMDELMALCDRLEAQQQERDTRHTALARASLARFAEAPAPANLDFLFHKSYTITPADLRKTILTLAVQGKLVPQDPNDEPAEVPSECEPLFEIPTNWLWRPLGSLGLCRTGRTPPTSDPTNYGIGFPFIGPGQITPSGTFTTTEKSITSKGLENGTEANFSDILMVCIGGSIGKAAICRERLGFNQQINSVRLKCDLPEFVYLALTSDYFQEQVLSNASGSATPIINKGKWERIPIPLPPLVEQRRIVAKVDQLMALVDELETQLIASCATAEKLMEAVVSELTAGSAVAHTKSSSDRKTKNKGTRPCLLSTLSGKSGRNLNRWWQLS